MKDESQRESGAPETSTLLGQILVQLGYITIYQLDEALQVQKQVDADGQEHQPLGQVLLEMGYCSPNQLIRAIQVQVEYRKRASASSS